jgi:hypothetical protein
MDESERLIARAALGSPADALRAWQQWRATYDPATASNLLVWAGGYVHRNIVAGGGRDEYLAGLARYNWVANQRQLVAAHDDLVELASLHALVALKSFDTSRTDDALSLRPVADIDLYVDARRLRRVVAWLRERGYVPLLDASDTEFFERVVPMRGSWNFMRTGDGAGEGAGKQECSIDLHWKFFDGLTLAENRRFARRWSRRAEASFGSVRALTPEARFALMAVQRQAQDDGKDTVLFDAGHIVRDLAPRTLLSVTRASRSHASVLSLLDAIAEFTDAPEVAELRDVVAADPAQQASLEDRGQPRTEIRTRRVSRTSLATLGGHDATDATDETIVNLTDDLPVGSGWFHLLPGDTWRWSTVPEARLRFAVPKLPNADRRRARTVPRTVQITVELNPTAWAVCSAPFVDVICNGKTIGRIDKSSATATFEAPFTARTRMVNLRFRGTGADLPAADPRSLVFNRIVAPVERIRLSPSNSTS